MPKMPFFANAWLTDTRVFSWISKLIDSTKANCKLCKKDFSLLNIAIKALMSQDNGSSHKKNVKHNQEIEKFLFKFAT